MIELSTIGEFINLVRVKAQQYDEAKIYYTLRSLKIKHITSKQVRAIQCFLALRDLGFKFVTTQLFASVMNISSIAAGELLHRLGDKGIIVLLRELKHRSFRYMLSEMFLSKLHEENQQSI